MQNGFDFADNSTPAFAESAPGTWIDPEFTTAQYRAMFVNAANRLESLPEAARIMFAYGIAAAMASHAEMLAWADRDDDEPYHLWRPKFSAHGHEIEAFITHCEQHLNTSTPGVEYKARKGRYGI